LSITPDISNYRQRFFPPQRRADHCDADDYNEANRDNDTEKHSIIVVGWRRSAQLRIPEKLFVGLWNFAVIITHESPPRRERYQD
jgi:hypothetical protein